MGAPPMFACPCFDKLSMTFSVRPLAPHARQLRPATNVILSLSKDGRATHFRMPILRQAQHDIFRFAAR